MRLCDPTLQALVERVEKLEAENRRLKKIGISALLLASALVLMGQAQTSKVIEANAFHLLDASGKVRARLDMEASDRPTLTFLTAMNSIPIALGGGDEPFLVLTRPGSDEQISVMANRLFYGLTLYDKTSARASLAVHKGLPALDLADLSGTPQATIEARPNGSTLFLKNPAGGESSMLWTDSSNGGASFDMRGSTGTLHVILGENPGGPSLELEDKEGYSTILGRADLLATATGRKERTPAASLVLLDKNRKVLWTAP